MNSFRCRIWLYTFLGVCYDVANKNLWQRRLLQSKSAQTQTSRDSIYMMWRYYLSEVVLRCDL